MLTINAPAKINLTLEVLRKRPDGFHEIRSVLQTVDLYDTLYIEPGEGISFKCDIEEWSAEKSLLRKAADLVQKTTGCKKGAVVRIEKRIPLMSGLGGDSSDAAALLKGLNELWELKLAEKNLVDMAAQLGSDVVFFLNGGTALASGRGEIIKPLPLLGRMWVVLVFPDIPVEIGKTSRMYASLKHSHFSDGSITGKLADDLRKGRQFRSSMLFNTFENVAFEDFNLKHIYVDHLVKLGALHVHLAGSGPALFTVFTDKTHAEDFFTRCKNQGMKAYLVETI